MKIKLYGSDDCSHCQELKSLMNDKDIPYIYVDVDLDETQDECDMLDVDALPDVVVFDSDGSVLFKSKGEKSFSTIIKLLQLFIKKDKK